MHFPPTNKLPQLIQEKLSDNAKLLEELLDAIQWRKFFNYYCAFLGIALFTLFSIIVTVRFALWLF